MSETHMLVGLQLYAAVSVKYVHVTRVFAPMRHHLPSQREQQAQGSRLRAAGCKGSSNFNFELMIHVANRHTLN